MVDLGACLRKFREAKGFSSKQVALACKMDSGHYSRVENGKTDPSFTVVAKIADALGVTLSDLFRADELLKDVSTADKSMVEKLALMESLSKEERKAIHVILDAFISKKKLKDSLSEVLHNVG